MGFDFLNKIFGIGKSHKEESTHKEPVKVPESVLDRFLIHSSEIYYIDSESESLIFAFKDGKMSVNDKYIDKDGDILFMSNKFREVTSKYCDIYYTSSTATNKLLPAVVT